MSSVGNEAQERVRALARQLKRMEGELSAEPEQTRHSRLRAEIERATKVLPREQAVALKDGIYGIFPYLNVTPPTSQPSANEALQLIEKGFQMMRRCDAPTRERMIRRIAELCASTPGLSGKSAPPAGGNGETNEISRVIQLATLLTETMGGLDDWSRGVWNHLVQANPVSDPPLSAAIAEFVGASDDDADLASISARLEQRLVASLRRIQALVAALKKMPQLHSHKFAPREIQDSVTKRLFASRKSLCWDQYVAMCGGLEAESLSFHIESMCAAVLEKLQTTPDALPSLIQKDAP